MIRFSKTAMFSGLLTLAGMLAGAGVAAAQTSANTATTATSQSVVADGLGNATGVAVDLAGNLYYVDAPNSTLQEVMGGNGSPTLLSNSLSSPGQVAVDASRNVYVADGAANVVLEYTYTNGTLSVNSPVSLGKGLGTVTGVAVDLSGAVYVVDATNKQVVKIASGNQTVVMTGLNAPRQIAVDRAGGIYVADAGANAVVYLPVGGSQQTIGTGFKSPSGVAVDVNNNLFVADTGNNAVKEIPYSSGPQTANQSTLALSPTAPYGIAVDTRGTLYVAAGTAITRYSIGAIYFGLLPVGQKSASVPVTVGFTAAAAPATIQVVTTGQTGLDFADAGADTCSAGASYAAGTSCVMNVTFTPGAPGPRMGAILMYDANNKVVARVFLGGGGLGPVITFDPGTISSVIPVSPTATLYPNNANTNPYPIAVSQPHGGRFDAAGNLYLADTGNNRVVEFPANASAPITVPVAVGIDDMALDGAGDIIVPNLSGGSLMLFPWENGTWNVADAVTIATGYTKPRTVSVDVAGNVFTCDTGNNKIYEVTQGAVQTQIQPGLTKGCIGVTVDLYGNVGVADSTGKTAYYIPVSGQTPYAVGSGYSAPWGVVFDASGSLIVSDNGITTLFRIPNENGSLSTADQLKIAGNKNYSIAIDAYGNLMTTPLVGTSIPSAGYNINMIARSGPTPFFAGQSTKFGNVAVGSTGTASALTVENSGNATPVYTAPTGVLQLGDIDDYSLTQTATSTYGTCNFGAGLQPGAACYVGIAFTPTSAGTLRTEWLSFPTANNPYAPQAYLYGTASGTAPTSAPSLSVSVTPNTGINPGQSLTVGVSASGTATGAVTLYVDGTRYQAAELNSSAASFTLPNGLAAGTHVIGSTYAGDKTNAPVTTPSTVSITINGSTPVLTLAANASDLAVGQTLILTGSVATATGLATPTGTATFFDGTTQLGTATLSNGVATFSTSALTAGTHTITFKYGGDGVYATGTSSSITVTVGAFTATTTQLTLSPVQPTGGYAFGSQVTATATVAPQSGSGTPTGTVQFSLDGVVQSVKLSGTTATLTLTPGAGTHVLRASYSGDATYDASTTTSTFITVQAATSTVLSASSAAFAAGSNVTLTATVSSTTSTPAGTVTFRNGVAVLGVATLNAKGVATLVTSALPAGTDKVTATYTGDANDQPSTSASMTIVVTINQTTVTVTSSPLIDFYGPVTLSAPIATTAPASVVAKIGGSVTFYVNGTLLGTSTVGSSGAAAFNWNSPTPGINTITATYTGDNNYAGSTTTTSYRMFVVPTGPYPGDYTVSMNPTPLNVTIGTPATATISVQTTNSYFGFVQLTCSGLPLYTYCQITPNQLTLDGSTTVQTAQLTVVSQASYMVAAAERKQTEERLCGVVLMPLFAGIFLGSFRRGPKMLRSMGTRGLVAVLFLFVAGGVFTGCGSHVPLATPAGTYTVNIVATGSGGVNHSTPVQMTFK